MKKLTTTLSCAACLGGIPLNLMKRLVPIAALALFSVAPVKAEFTELETINLGILNGWIQATCVYAEKNLLDPDFAEPMIKTVLDKIANTAGRKRALVVRKITLGKYPKCLPFMPREYLVD